MFKLNNSNKYIKQVKFIINDPIELICNAFTVSDRDKLRMRFINQFCINLYYMHESIENKLALFQENRDYSYNYGERLLYSFYIKNLILSLT